MYLSGTIDKFDGTIEPNGTHLTNGGTYWDVFSVDPSYENWFETVYGPDQSISQNHVPSHVTVTYRSDGSSTISVQEQDTGSSPSESPTRISSTTTTNNPSGSQVAHLKTEIESKYFRVKIQTNAGTSQVCSVVRLKDEYK